MKKAWQKTFPLRSQNRNKQDELQGGGRVASSTDSTAVLPQSDIVDSFSAVNAPQVQTLTLVPSKSVSTSFLVDGLKRDDNAKDLWEQACKKAFEEEPALMGDYVRHLKSDLGGSVSLSTSQSVESVVKQLLAERESKQWHFSLLGKDIKIREQADNLAKFLVWSDGIVKGAVSAQPYAALAWSAVQILLPLITSCTAENEIMLEGFNAICHVQMYWKVSEEIYFDDSADSIRQTISPTLVLLYSAIIVYQARVVCHLSKGQLHRAWEKITSANGWKSKSAEVNSLNENCKELIDPSKEKRLRQNWLLQLDQMMQQISILDGVRQLLEDGNHQRERHYEDDNEKKLLKTLASNYEGDKDFNPVRVTGTCEWFFKDEKFCKWRASNRSAAFWVSAGPGCGKSVLSRTLIDEKRLSIGVTTSTVCYFFFKSGQERRMDAANALSAILHQLFRYDLTGDFMSYGLEAYRNFSDQLPGNLSELWRTLIKCARCPNSGEIICVLDALDECNEASRYQLLEKLKEFYSQQRLQSTSRLKFLITCRPYDSIEQYFSKLSDEDAYMYLDADDNSDHVTSDISRVIDYRLDELASGLSSGDRQSLAERLKGNKDRTYLWLYLIFGIIEQRRSAYAKRSSIDQLLSRLPLEVFEAYEEILGKSQDDGQAEIVLRIVLAATRPLTLDEMNIALTSALQEDSFHSHADLESNLWGSNFNLIVQNLCGLFISVHDSQLYFIHQTAKEFLLDNERKNGWRGRLKVQASHRTLSQVCLSYLLLPLPSYSDRVMMQEADKYHFLAYAAANWAFHLRSQGPIIPERSRKDARELCRADVPAIRERIIALHPSLRYSHFSELSYMPDMRLASCLGLASVVYDMVTKENPDLGDCGDDDWYGRNSAFDMAVREGHLDVMLILFYQGELRYSTKKNTYKALFEHSQDSEPGSAVPWSTSQMKVTTDFATAVAKNRFGSVMMNKLLNEHGDEIKITSDLVKTAVSNDTCGLSLLQAFLDRCRDKVEMTEDLLTAAAEVDSHGTVYVLTELLEIGEGKIKITERVLVAAASNERYGAYMIHLLIAKGGDDITVTEGVLVAAANNEEHGEDMLRLLITKGGDDIIVTERILTAAANNEIYGEDILRLLIANRGDDIIVTEGILIAAAKNRVSGEDILRLLIAKYGDDIRITEGLLSAVARDGLAETMAILLDHVARAGGQVRITGALLQIAADNSRYGRELVALLLERCDGKDVEALRWRLGNDNPWLHFWFNN